MRYKHRISGFTLIELLAVISIIMVVVALAIPNFAAMIRSQKWAAASGALQNALLRCQTFAVNERRDHSVELCITTDNNSQYFRIETESALLESIPDLNDYYQNQCEFYYMRLPEDWLGAFVAGGGTVVNYPDHPWGPYPATRFDYPDPRPKYDVSRGDWRIDHTIKDNLKVDDDIFLPHSIKIDYANSKHLINYDAPPGAPSDLPQYGWDYTPDFRFNQAGILVQAQNPELVLMNTAGEHMRLQILRSTARLRKLSGLD